MGLLASGDLKVILDILDHMEQNETTVAEFYHACGELWPQYREFWLGIEAQEHKHALNIQKMKAIIGQKPEHFEKGRPFNIMAVQTIIKGVQNNIAKLRSGQLQMINALAIARDSEQAMIESRYNEIVTTQDVEYLTLVQEIVQDTTEHRLQIDRMFAAIKK
jgi:hypothetical protein